MFDNNFGKCGPIFKSKKMLPNFHVERDD